MEIEPTGTLPAWSKGLSWNFVAFAFAAAAVLAANVLIARDFGPGGLGVFGQTLTWFALMAQVAALGVHYAVLHLTANSASVAEARRAVNGGATVVALIASFAAIVSYFLAPVVGSIVSSAPLVDSIRFASGALLFHALAKVVAAGLNGTRRMAAFSSVSAARATGMLAAVLYLGASQASTGHLGLVFLASEVGAFLAAVIAWGRIWPRFDLQQAVYFAKFGARAAVAAVTVEVNSRVDIAVLGVATSDEVVGVYTLAATAFEGIFQIFVILRNQVNPSVAAAVVNGEPREVDALVRRLWPAARIVTLLILVLAGLLTGWAVDLFGLSQSFLEARTPLLILLGGLLLAAPLLPFDQLLVVGGEPGAQSRVVLTSLGINLALNVALVPWLGVIGAALGTACAILSLVVGVSIGGRRLFGTRFSLWTRPAPQ